jgi:hypothetical protein
VHPALHESLLEGPANPIPSVAALQSRLEATRVVRPLARDDDDVMMVVMMM